MPRILGVDIPNNKKVPYSLSALFGIGLDRGNTICESCQIDVNKRAYQLTEEELGKISTFIESNYVIEGNRGYRHARSLPCRGQRTRTNSRTRKGKKKTVANKKILRK